MSLYNHPGCSCCGGPFNGGNCPSCSSVGSENEFVYDPNPYSYNETPNFFNQPLQHQYETYSCEFCGNDAHYGYNCPPQVPFISNPGPCYNQDFDNFPQTSPGFQQQYLCCENCRGPHETFQFQSLNQNFYEPNLCYNSIASDFDQFQPLAVSRHSSTSSKNKETPKVLLLDWDTFFKIKQVCSEKLHQQEDLQELFHKLLKDLQIISEELANYINIPNWNCPAFYEDDDEEYTIAITPILPTEEPDNSLSMGDEHLSTIPETESDELIKSSVENLVPSPSESEDFSDIESECDVPVCDDFTTISNPFFDADDDFSSSNDESFSDEDIPKEIYSNPLFDEEIISDKIDASIVSSPKFDSLLEEFSGELAHIDLIPPRINEADLNPRKEFILLRNLTLMEEIDLFLTSDDSMPPGIENDDYDSEGGIIFFEELLSNDSPSLPINESFHFDVPSSPRPPAKPPDDDEIKPKMGVLTTKVMGDISELYVHVPNVLTTLPTLSPMFDTLLPFSSENDDKVFHHGILASNEEKSPHLLSHQGFKAFQDIFDFSKSPMMIYGEDIPILDVLFLHFYPP
ncbi:hypothetical protein Tco_0328574 [Tanacetum coccineum]